jgi:uncharacterized protein YecE (DUF72 family)
MKTPSDAPGRRKGNRPGKNSHGQERPSQLPPQLPEQMTLGQPRPKQLLEKSPRLPKTTIPQHAPDDLSKPDNIVEPDETAKRSPDDGQAPIEKTQRPLENEKIPTGNARRPGNVRLATENAQPYREDARSRAGNDQHETGDALRGATSQHSSQTGALNHFGASYHPGDRKFGRVLIGPAGWSYSDWNRILYPASRPRDFHEASFLAEYFDTIEINTSFYQPVRPAHAELWVQRIESNPRFLYTAKLWRKFTHEEGATAEDEQLVREGFHVLRSAGRLGAVLLQFPFSFHYTPQNLDRLKKMLDSFGDYPLVVEVRHASWSAPDFLEFLARRGTGICNIDQPVIGKSIKPTERATASTGYVRLHGRRYDTWFSDDPETPSHERYNYLYSGEELEPWAARIRHVSAHAETTFVVTNNHFEAKGVVNALQLINMLTGEKVKVPEELRHHYPQLESIADAPAEEPTLFPIPPK